jgi:putative SOS response-associated peptidase YedK
MCFTVKQTAKAKKYAEKYGVKQSEFDEVVREVSEKLNAFDHPMLQVLCNNEVKPLRWGLIPAWVKSREDAQKFQNQTLNAKAETAFEKPSFKDAIRSRRCISPVDAFYEWQHVGKGTIPFIIKPRNDELLSLAGIWETWISPLSKTPVVGFSILTCAANPTMSLIHNTKRRMPVILSSESVQEWLSLDLPEALIKRLTVPCPDEWLVAERTAIDHQASFSFDQDE